MQMRVGWSMIPRPAGCCRPVLGGNRREVTLCPLIAMLDVLIQTHNEQLNLPHTLESLRAGAGDLVRRIFVVDSGSTDRTREIAEGYGATFVFHEWEGYAAQKNWAIDHLPFESEWVLILDADEAISTELREEIKAIVSRPVEEVAESAFHINRVFIFMGQRIRHCGYFPSWNLRLFKRGHARYEQRLVHEHMIVTGKTGYLRHLLIHEDRRGLEHFIAKHNRYSTLEAEEIYAAREEWPGLHTFMTDRVTRRRYLKNRVLPFLPMPWVLRFVYMYFLKMGFLDGRAGWYLCLFISSYEFFIRMKYAELLDLRGVHHTGVGGLSVAEGRIGSTAGGAPATDSVSALAGMDGGGLAGSGVGSGLAGGVRAEGGGTAGSGSGGVAGGGSASALLIPVLPVARVAGGARAVPSIASDGVVLGVSRDHGAESDGRVIEPSSPAVVPQLEKRVAVSVMIPTLNEGQNLARCLDHLRWADEVIVVDSNSTDETVEIAHRYGAKVVNFNWSGKWPKKKNWSLKNIAFRNEWVLIVDADEWVTPELADEISRTIKTSKSMGYYINRRLIFMGRWVRHCGHYRPWNMRLIRRGYCEYEQLTDVDDLGSGDNEVHEHMVVHGEVGHLNHDMLHFAFPSIHVFMEKHNRYSSWDAAVHFIGGESPRGTAPPAYLSRRRKLKSLSRRLPFRPTLRFLYSFIWQGGFLDGRPGFVFCRLLAIYEYLSVSKYYEYLRAEEDQRKTRQMSSVPAMTQGSGQSAPSSKV